MILAANGLRAATAALLILGLAVGCPVAPSPVEVEPPPKAVQKAPPPKTAEETKKDEAPARPETARPPAVAGVAGVA